jgi:hypothetical protein
MTSKKLSDCYSIATLRMHDMVTELYENLFNKEGEPITDRNKVSDTMIDFFKKYKIEASLIIESVTEYNE